MPVFLSVRNWCSTLTLLTSASMLKSGLTGTQATNKFAIAALELRRVSHAMIEMENASKREVIEGDKADGARKKVAKAAEKMLRIRKGKEEIEESGEGAVVEATPARAPETSPSS